MTSSLKKLPADCFKTFSGRPEDWIVSGPCHLYRTPFCSFNVLVAVGTFRVLYRPTPIRCWGKSLILCTMKPCCDHLVQPAICSKSCFQLLPTHFAVSKTFLQRRGSLAFVRRLFSMACLVVLDKFDKQVCELKILKILCDRLWLFLLSRTTHIPSFTKSRKS